jgi:hypothetical protein
VIELDNVPVLYKKELSEIYCERMVFGAMAQTTVVAPAAKASEANNEAGNQ